MRNNKSSSKNISHQRAEENPHTKHESKVHQNKEFPSTESSIGGERVGKDSSELNQQEIPLSERIREAQKIQEPVQNKQEEESKQSKAEQQPIGGKQEGITNDNYGVSESPIETNDEEPGMTTTHDEESYMTGGRDQNTTDTGEVGIKESEKVNQPEQFKLEQPSPSNEQSNEPWTESQRQEWKRPDALQQQQKQEQKIQQSQMEQQQSQMQSEESPQPSIESSKPSTSENVQWKPTSNEPTFESSSNIGQFKKDDTEFNTQQQRSKEQLQSGFSQMKNEIDYGEQSYKGNNRLMGRKVLISGDEFGRGVVISFIREGADVCFNYLPNRQKDVDSLYQLLEKEIKENNRKLEFIPGDLKNESFCKEMVNEAKNKLGGLDCLVLTAGKQREVSDITDLSLDNFRETFEVNLFSMFNIVKAAIPHLSTDSTIITTSSIEAFKSSPNLLDFSCSKAAVISFTQTLAKQLASKGIRVNSIAPGNIVTSRHPSIKVENSDLKRCGQPFELSSLFVYLASNESSYCTGSIFPLSGGNVF